MADDIQRTSTVPVPLAQGIVSGRDTNVLGSIADQGRVEKTTQKDTNAFADYLEKTAVMSELRAKKSNDFDITDEVLRASPYNTGV
jgi:hypothetical protein